VQADGKSRRQLPKTPQVEKTYFICGGRLFVHGTSRASAEGMPNPLTLTSDQLVLRALRELCRGAGERQSHPEPSQEHKDPEPPSLPSSVRNVGPDDER